LFGFGDKFNKNFSVACLKKYKEVVEENLRLDGMENAFWVGVVGVLGGLGPARAWSI
jgi:hypothetical protein